MFKGNKRTFIFLTRLEKCCLFYVGLFLYLSIFRLLISQRFSNSLWYNSVKNSYRYGFCCCVWPVTHNTIIVKKTEFCFLIKKIFKLKRQHHRFFYGFVNPFSRGSWTFFPAYLTTTVVMKAFFFFLFIIYIRYTVTVNEFKYNTHTYLL